LQSWKLFKILGIPIRVHSSCLLIFIIFSWATKYQIEILTQGSISSMSTLSTGIFTSFLLFFSVLLHELFQSFVAINQGIKVNGITLFFLGGVSEFEQDCSDPIGNIKIAISGPIISLIISFLFFSYAISLEQENLILINTINRLGWINFLIAIFNLIPLLPLDGGIILKSVIWYLTGSEQKGNKIAYKAAKIFSYIIIFFGGILIFGFRNIFGFWIILLGFLTLNNTRSQIKLMEIESILTNRLVKELYLKNLNKLTSESSLYDLSRFYLDDKKSKKEDIIFIYEEGRWIGYITGEILNDISIKLWKFEKLINYIKPMSEISSISENLPLYKAIEKIENTEKGIILVNNSAGLPIGLVSRNNLGIFILKNIGINLPKEFYEVYVGKNLYPLGLNLPKISKKINSKNKLD